MNSEVTVAPSSMTSSSSIVAPSSSNMAPSSSIMAPSSSIMASSSSVLAPSSSVMAPSSSVLAPSSSVLTPSSSIMAPSSMTSSSSVLAPSSSIVAPSSSIVEPSSMTFSSSIVAPASSVLAPSSSVLAPSSSVLAPSPMTSSSSVVAPSSSIVAPSSSIVASSSMAPSSSVLTPSSSIVAPSSVAPSSSIVASSSMTSSSSVLAPSSTVMAPSSMISSSIMAPSSMTSASSIVAPSSGIVSSSSVVSSPPPQTPATKATLAAKRDCRKSTSTTPAFLSNLGRATLRGIRRCPQCGVYNGTRGLSCKNEACGVSLRSASAVGKIGKKSTVEVVRVVTDSEERGEKEQEGGGVLGGAASGGAQVFSVCHRGRGSTATQWGFVELVPTDTAIATGDGATLLTRINLGRCFLPSCRQGQRSNQRESDPAGAKPSSDSLCVHIKQAIECQKRSSPLTFKSSVLEGLQASIQAREELWRLATESPGPLVQRVSKDTLVVKCHTDSHHPLGLLHFTVGAAGPSEASKGERSVFHCACQVGTRRSRTGVDGSAGSHPPPSSLSPQLCLHFYACVCAFASNEKLSAEFAAFISYTSSGVQLSPPSGINPSEKLLQAEAAGSHQRAKKLRLDESASGSSQVVDEHAVTMGFHQWLAGVTERIHQTMHFQFDGKPQPLVYHIPQEFFNALQQRLSLGSKKRRLPNFTAVVKNDGLLQGSFSKYSWHLSSLLQVKRIFDTPELPLEVTQSFVKNVDGSFSRFRCPEPPPEPELLDGHRTDRSQAIRPMELRTFLKVGPGTAEQKEASPFVIEWIPDVLPRCQMGELRISFEFGHQQSGQQEAGEKTAEKAARNKPDCSQTQVASAFEVIQVIV